ncbi:UBX domain-containing protein 4 [Myotis brandtii]|uniref:UBX domain-containing protein 4 n=1 Tax=Myotis brandtii TaxID=109478 RepID=S7MRV6_MYOBR|nr:UBX domain-containing protein 4 [Myotis brandtii]
MPSGPSAVPGVGDDEQSTQMAASWEDEKVSEASSDSFVAIKIDTKSEACLQFSQIYPVVCVPSSFFIGDSGIPLEVIAGSVSADELVTRIHKVRQMHSLKGETSEASGSQSESSLSTPSTSFEPNSTSENTQSRNVELCEASPTSDTATGVKRPRRRRRLRPRAPGTIAGPGGEACCAKPCPQAPLPALGGEAVATPAGFRDFRQSGSRGHPRLAMPASSWDLAIGEREVWRTWQSRRPLDIEQSEREGGLEGGEKSDHATSSQEPRGCSDPRPSEDLTVKVERLTKKLEERREEKRKEEEQREIKKEIERRKTGKEMLDYKRKQEEELTKRMLEERNREKAEDRAARERIKQQIALDRAERAARFAKTKEEVEAAKAAALLVKQAEMEVKRDASARERSTVARIQFRLPDGSSFTNQFPSDAPLEEARQFAAQTVGNTYGNFSLATMFPRREFTKEDYKKKLLDLELAPSASVVLLPTSVRSSSESSNLASSSNSEKREPVRKRVLEKRGEDFKKEGKIYRLRTQDDGEDENNTWNGNSTQQM